MQAHKLATQTPPVDYLYIKSIAQAMQNKMQSQFQAQKHTGGIAVKRIDALMPIEMLTFAFLWRLFPVLGQILYIMKPYSILACWLAERGAVSFTETSVI